MQKRQHCHCGLSDQFHKFRAKKLGLVGAALLVGHLLFHVVECLILPVIIVGFSSHHEQSTAKAESSNEASALSEELFSAGTLTAGQFRLKLNLRQYGVLGLSNNFSLSLPPLPKAKASNP